MIRLASVAPRWAESGLILITAPALKGVIADLVRIAEQRLGSKDILLPGGFADGEGDVFERSADVFDRGLAQPHRQLGENTPCRRLEVPLRMWRAERLEP